MYGLQLAGALGSLVGLAAALAGTYLWLRIAGWLVFAVFSFVLFFGLLMLIYNLAGKRRTRDLLLSKVPWTGSESVLDIGTGAGFLAVAVAKRLTSGHVTGIDLWSKADLSNNSPAAAERNVRLENTADKIKIQTGDARKLDFADGSFDCVVSLLCLHNIEDKSEQKLACSEIARVLRPSGYVVIGDYLPVAGYASALQASGLSIIQMSSAFTTALSLMWFLVAVKK
jgi:ubiquinone/menaquinone biosynthesis C-methylase UbiE